LVGIGAIRLHQAIEEFNTRLSYPVTKEAQ
jgi:hypothetical protein